jgi:O-antigen/teichoic acid export membrane protein
LDATAVGLYDAGVRLAELWYFFPGVIISSLLPPIINAKKIDESQYKRRLIRLAVLVTSLSFAYASLVTLIARPLMNLVFGGEFIGGYTALQIYVWSGIGVGIGLFINQYLITENRSKLVLYISFIGMTLNVILNIILIPLYGINGAALSTLISYTVGPLFVFISKTDVDNAQRV